MRPIARTRHPSSSLLPYPIATSQRSSQAAIMLSDRGRDLVIFMVVFNSTTLISLALRFYVVFYVRRRPVRIDDYIILLSTASLLAVEGAMAWGMSSDTPLSCLTLTA